MRDELQVDANVERAKAEVTAQCERLIAVITAHEVATHARLDAARCLARAQAQAMEHLSERGQSIVTQLSRQTVPPLPLSDLSVSLMECCFISYPSRVVWYLFLVDTTKLPRLINVWHTTLSLRVMRV